MWLKVVLALSLLGAGYGAVKLFDKNSKEVARLQGQVLQCSADLVASTAEKGRLNQRIRDNNAEKLVELAKADAQIAQANEAAAQARKDRAIAQEDVRRAQERYRELLASDAALQAYSRAVVPDAVLDRLRVANGEAIGNR